MSKVLRVSEQRRRSKQSTEGEDASELELDLCTTIPLVVTISNKAEKNPS